MTYEVKNLKNITELQKLLESKINTLKQNSERLSKLVGEKLRNTETTDTAELQDLREKIEGTTNDPKKKKVVKKKDQKSNWHTLDTIAIYDGIGLKGELELYFNALESTKSELEQVTKVKQAVDDLVNKGVKRDLGCVFSLNHELPAKIAFINSIKLRTKFTYNAIFDVPEDRFDQIQI